MRRQFTIFAVLGCVALTSCGGDADKVVDIPGERISVLSYERTLTADPRAEENAAVIPPSFRNSAWSQPGGFPSNAAYHLALGEVQPLFQVDLVSGNGGQSRITAPPIVAEGKVFAMGAELDVAAADASSGKKLWAQSVAPEWRKPNRSLTRFIGIKSKSIDPETGFTGGIAYGDGKLFVATGFGEIVALSAGTGEILWRHRAGIPFSNAPTVRNGRIYVVSQDSRLQVFSTDDGRLIWDYLAITETAGVMGASSPAVTEQVAVAGFNSGEVVSLRVLNGTPNWSDSLSSRSMQVTPMSELTAIVGRPVIDRDRVFAVSHGGRMVSIDLRSGERAWTVDVGSIETPWVTGNSVIVVSLDAQLISLTRNLGRVRWVSQLPAFEDPEDREGRISWAGPILAGGQLILASSRGDLYFVSPEDGSVLRAIELDDPVNVTPIVADATLYLLTDEGELLAYR